MTGTFWVGVAGACYEPPAPFWLLDEEPLALGYEIEVVLDGPLATTVPPLHPELRRKEPLPLDTVLITPITATRHGVLGPADFVPAWFLCPTDAPFACERKLSDPATREHMMRPCLTDQAHLGCLIGYANPLPMVWPLPSGPLPPDDEFDLWLLYNMHRTILMVGGTADGVGTAECVQRLQQGGVDVHGCAIGRYTIVAGPALSLVEIFEGLGLYDEETIEVPMLEEPIYADVAPRIDGIVVDIEGSESFSVEVGDVVHVPHDTLVELAPDFDPKQLQTYLDYSSRSLNERGESLAYALYFDQPARPRNDVLRAAFTVPPDVEELTAIMLVGDNRNGWSWLEIPIVASD